MTGPDVVVRTNARGVIVSVSATCSVYGYEPRDLVGKAALDFVHPDDRARFVENTASLYDPAAGSGSNARVHRFKRKDGSWAWLRGNPRMLPETNGRPGEVLNFFEPLSEAAANALLG
jgi:PAS domain S-box-containing protein